MNNLSKLFLVSLIAFSGSMFAACTSCRGNGAKRARVTVMRKSQARKISANRQNRKTNRPTRKAHRSRASLAAFIHKKKGGCTNGVCTLS